MLYFKPSSVTKTDINSANMRLFQAKQLKVFNGHKGWRKNLPFVCFYNPAFMPSGIKFSSFRSYVRSFVRTSFCRVSGILSKVLC